MANQTYLQLVNYVLTELRESNVSTTTYSAYSTLIGQWVNDAKQMVEDAWDWSALNVTQTFTLVPNQLTYSLNNSGVALGTCLYDSGFSALVTERSRIRTDVENPYRPMAFDVTVGTPMQLIQYPYDLVLRTRTIQPTPLVQTQPMFFGVNRTSNNLHVELFETPTVARNWVLYMVVPQEPLVNDSDNMYVPWRPVASMVIDRAMNERGEEVGEPGTTLAQRAQTHIDNAIGSDSREQTHLTTFFPG